MSGDTFDAQRAKQIKQLQLTINRARKQRNATTDNEQFDMWHEIMLSHAKQLELLLKTGESNAN